MSLSRPASFPLLKLPWLCIKCVIHNSDLLDIIYFATISNRTRRIVQHSKYPLKEIDVHPSGCSKIHIKDQLGKTENDKTWYFLHNMRGNGIPLVLKRNSQPLPTRAFYECWRGYHLESYTDGDELNSLKMGIEFMVDVFGCTVRQVKVDGNKLSELFGLGVSTVKVLFIGNSKPVNITNLKYLLKNMKVTDRYVFCAPIAEDFSCDPQIFKCQKLNFARKNSADWVTLEILCQFDVPQLYFWGHRFSVEDIVSYVTHWFNSENQKLEYVEIHFDNRITIDDFKINHLNPIPFCEKRRSKCPLAGKWEYTDISSGKDILRKDELLATFYVDFESTTILFYIWHKRFPDAV
ncbi:unnamed protein product [Caenorhabditis brenneri]